MRRLSSRTEHTLEVMLVLITLALACILYAIERSQVVVLNLFFLPTVLAAFFLGCYRAGVLAFLAVIAASSVIMCDLSRFSFVQSPLSIALSVIIWGAVLGLTAMLVGTLSDERAQRTREMDEAHLGVIEVLTQYLQASDPDSQAQSRQVDALAMQVAERMQLPHAERDNMRRAALLMNLDNLEITARVVRRAVGADYNPADTFADDGTDHPFMESLGSALCGAFPLVLRPGTRPQDRGTFESTLGTRILFTVRRYVALQVDGESPECLTPDEALATLRSELHRGKHDPAVLFVLEEIVREQLQGISPSPIGTGNPLLHSPLLATV